MYLEPEFPVCVSAGSVSMPTYSTRVVTSGTGWESRNSNWQETRIRFNAATGVRGQIDLDDLVEFFHAVKGQALAFRFKDWGDYKSKGVADPITMSDQHLITSIAGGETVIPLRKVYEAEALYTYRDITQPVPGTILVAKDGSPLADPGDYTIVDGKIVLGVALAAGEQISAGFEFDVPCRFDSDELATQLEAFMAGSVTVPVIEVQLLP